MAGIPNDQTCSICESLRTSPAKDKLQNLSQVNIAWCVFHKRRLLEPALSPSISSTVCSKFTSIYRPGVTYTIDEWRPPACQGNSQDYLWRIESNNLKSPYWTFEPYCLIEKLERVNPESGDLLD
jgi:hypothetical protein